MLSTLSRQVLARIQKDGCLRPGERVGVAVSGGADSVALLLLLMDLRGQLGILPSVVHLNHKLRGKASDADERFVAELASRAGLEFHLKRFNAAAKAKRQKLNLEDAGRKERYAFFAALVKEGRLDRVAVAHTADDQAETVLSHILRGTGLAGLGGIHPRSGCVVRPLLGIRRAELRKYLRMKKQRWREDATNRDESRMRARIRRKLLPVLEKRFQGAVVEHLVRLADLAREDEAFLDSLARDSADKLLNVRAGCVQIRIDDFLQQQRALMSRIIRRTVAAIREQSAAMKPAAGQLNAEHVQAIVALAERGQSGKSLLLPGGIVVRRERDALIFVESRSAIDRQRQGNPESFSAEIELSASLRETCVPAPHLSCVFRLRVIDWPSERGETRPQGAVFDRDRLRFPLLLRSWHPGDRLRLPGHRAARKLKRLLNEKHVSRWEREGWPVLVSDGTIVWARGFSVAAGYGAYEGTRAGVVIEEQFS